VEDLVNGPRSAPDPAFWRGKRVLLTGHTGFKGAWLALWLDRMGAEIIGVALAPTSSPSLFELARVAEAVEHHTVDVRSKHLPALVAQAQPEVIFHLAAQALVPAGYQDPVGTWSTNVMGTVAVLDALRRNPCARAAVIVTTDKVYRNSETGRPHREDDELGGDDPYSASKAASELAIASYRRAFLSEQGLALASARAGNVIGGGDWAADRVVPDAVRAWSRGKTLEVRRPEATRPWQHVLEPLAAYLVLAQHLYEPSNLTPLPAAWNFGPPAHERATVRDVVELAREAWGSGSIVRYNDHPSGPHEAGLLALDTSLAAERLGLSSRWTLLESVRHTMRWYRRLADGADARDLCMADLTEWEAAT